MHTGEGAQTPDAPPRFGYCVFLGDNLPLLLFFLKKKTYSLGPPNDNLHYLALVLKLNTMEMPSVVSKSCLLHNLLFELHCPILKVTLVYCDNFSVIYLSSNSVQHQHTKHNKMDIHLFRENVAREHVYVHNQMSDTYRYINKNNLFVKKVMLIKSLSIWGIEIQTSIITPYQIISKFSTIEIRVMVFSTL
jgi:hypothetical protein